MNESNVEYTSAGREFSGFLAEPAVSGPRAGVLVLHGGAGPGAHERDRARRLAGLGYVAFAPDLFGEAFASRARGVEVITALVERPAVLRERLHDSLAFLRGRRDVAPERTAAIGFCFGGLAALELARSGAPVRSVVSFHGGLTTRAPAEEGRVQASVLVCTGAADPFVPREHRGALEEEMSAAGADWQMHVYARATHAFTVRDVAMTGCAYDEPSDRRSWRSMCELFEETLGR